MKLLTLARDLQRRKAREKHRRFVAEGVRTVESLLASPLEVVGLLHTEQLRSDARGAAILAHAEAMRVPTHQISDADLVSAADTESPQGVLAVAAIPGHRLPAAPAGARFLLLDAIQDPGNVGTIIRTAAALGVTATVALPGTVDLWNAKVVRSTMGALFTHPVVHATWPDVEQYLTDEQVSLWVAAGDGTMIDAAGELPDRLMLAVGNEGAGVSSQVGSRAQMRIGIRMHAGIESLNVAVATGILLHALAPQTH